MSILSKEVLDEKLGQYEAFSRKKDALINNKAKYLGGIKFLDNYIDEHSIEINLTSFWIRPNGVELEFAHEFKSTRVGIFNKAINYWTIEPQKAIAHKKSNPIVKKALAIGVLLSSKNTRIGGITRIKGKGIKVPQIDNIITFSFEYNGTEELALFSCNHKIVEDVRAFFTRNWPSKLKVNYDQWIR